MKLYIKYMVSLRCKLVVKDELKNLGLHYYSLELGEVDIIEEITPEQRVKLSAALLKAGLEVLDDKKGILIERIKSIITELIHYSDETLKINFSDYLAEKLDYDYNYMAALFVKSTGLTIEKYVIQHRVEYIKELLLYDELNISQIAKKLGYSSSAHLSNQFKRTTGLTPIYFKKIKQFKRRIALENL